MKKLTLTGVLLSAVLLAPAAHAAGLSGVYVAGDLGRSFARDIDADIDAGGAGAFDYEASYDSSFLVSGAAGYRFAPQMRAELELSYSKADIGSGTLTQGAVSVAAPGEGDVSRTALMVNGFYDFTNTSKITPYVGAGVGLARLNVDGDDHDTVFAYQLAAGAALAVTDNVSVTLGYRWFDAAEGKFNYTDPTLGAVGFEDDFSDHQIRAGVRYSF